MCNHHSIHINDEPQMNVEDMGGMCFCITILLCPPIFKAMGGQMSEHVDRHG